MITLLHEADGTEFGKGETKEDAIADAVDNAFYEAETVDGDAEWIACTEVWIRERISDGALVFVS